MPKLAAELGIHRSMAYRLVQTLERGGFVERRADSTLIIGARLAGIGRNVARDLQSAATPALLAAATDLELTVFLVIFDGEAAVTLVSVDPPMANAIVGQRPGTRHPVDSGAPGRAIRSQLDPACHPPRRFEISHDEVVPGLAAIALPLAIAGQPPASVATLYLSSRVVDEESVVARLGAVVAEIAERIR